MFLKNTKNITVEPFIPDIKDDKHKNNKQDFVMQTNHVSGNNSPKAKINMVKQLSKVLAPNSNTVKKKTKTENSQQQKTFLVNQNKLLKQQTLGLIEQLSSLLGEIKPKKYGINLTEQNESEQVKLKKVKLANQQIKISELQNKLAFQKRQLQLVFDDTCVKEKQADVKILQKQLRQMEKQKNGILNISKGKTKQIESVKMSPQFQQRVNKTREQLSKIKDQCKALSQKTLQNQRLLRKKHEKVVSKQNKIKFIQKKIKQNQQKIRKGQTQKVVTVEMISQIQSQISQLEEERLLSEQSWNQKMTNLDQELNQRRLQLQKKQIILKDKQKQVRLNQLRMKELKKLVTNQNTQINRRSSMTDGQDAGKVKGRVRNIKRLDNEVESSIAEKKLE